MHYEEVFFERRRSSTASREDLLNDEAATWAGLCANWLALDDKGELSHC